MAPCGHGLDVHSDRRYSVVVVWSSLRQDPFEATQQAAYQAVQPPHARCPLGFRGGDTAGVSSAVSPPGNPGSARGFRCTASVCLQRGPWRPGCETVRRGSGATAPTARDSGSVAQPATSLQHVLSAFFSDTTGITVLILRLAFAITAAHTLAKKDRSTTIQNAMLRRLKRSK